MRWRLLAIIAVLSSAAVSHQADAGLKKGVFYFKDGDVIVMMGDSITEQLLYSNYVEMWTVTRFPDYKLTFRNVGIGGDRSTGGNSRFKRDVLAHGATAMTVSFGMNDGNYKPFDEKAAKTYVDGLRGIWKQAEAAKIRVAWITPQPVEHNPGDEKEKYNDTLEKFGKALSDDVVDYDKYGVFVNQFHPYWTVIEKARAAGEKGRITGGDAVHPGPPGQALMAASILKALNFPRQVSNVSLFAGASKPDAVRNCLVSGLKNTPDLIEFTRLDLALPFFPAEAKSILKFTPLLEDMNQLGVQVSGLKGKWKVQIGDQDMGTYSADQLTFGVNLAARALEAGPIADQVNKVWAAVKDKNKYFHDEIFRGVVLANAKSKIFEGVDPKDFETKRKAAYDERMKKMPALDAAVREALNIRPYPMRLTRVEKE